MKKTLIALAAVALSGAAFAQSSVTLSGLVGAQIKKVDGSNTTFGFHDADVTFTAVEDLGGGLKVTAAATMNFEEGRGGSAGGEVAVEDVNLSLAGAFGTVRMGRIEAGNGIIGRAYAGAPVMGSDNGLVLAAPSNVNILSYASPSIAGFTVGVSTTSPSGVFAGGSALTGASESVSVSYAAGPLSIGADYNNNAKRSRVSASYDLGVAKLGAGYEQRKVGGAGDGYAFGVSVPMGALTLGAAYSANLKQRTASSLDFVEKAAAFEVGAAYALSKRTTLSTAYVKHNTEAEAASGAGYAYRVRMTHAF